LRKESKERGRKREVSEVVHILATAPASTAVGEQAALASPRFRGERRGKQRTLLVARESHGISQRERNSDREGKHIKPYRQREQEHKL